jgi:putative DNA primase/helicase
MNHNPFSNEDKRRLKELAEMSPAQYGRCRDDLAAKLGIAKSYLDQEYQERRKRVRAEDSDDDFLADPEPWPEPVDGADLLDLLSKTVAVHVVLPNAAAEAIALWVLLAHAHDCFDISSLLCATSPTPECGKTTLLTFLSRICPRALLASNISPASVFRAVEKWSPTLLVDEADTFLRDNEELRGILNSGHNRGSAYVIRTVGESHEPARFCTWTAKVLALIGKLPPTLASRSIHIELRRKMASEDVTELREGRLGHLKPILRQAARWAQDNMDALRSAEPEMPKSLYGRAADQWRPLLAVADRAGSQWPKRARRVAETLGGRCIEQTAGVMLLDDIRSIFAERADDQISSASTIDSLTSMEDRPWPEWKSGKSMTARQLAKMLEPFGIGPKQLWIAGCKQRGYERAQFEEAFGRYLEDLSGSPVEPLETASFSDFDPVGPSKPLPDNNREKPSKPNGSTVLPMKSP